MSQLFVLYEHASGYSLFRVKEFEEVAMFIPEVEKASNDFSRLSTIVKLVGFTPFSTGTNALENMNSISEGIVHPDLQLFLETHIPKPGKKESIVLGVGDPKIGAAIQELFGTSCQQAGAVPEIIRAIRLNFFRYIKGLTDKNEGRAQLGLGHAYSRAKVKFNVHRVDNMIIQSISLLDQLDKDLNTFCMRIREWYSYHFPELIRIVPDNQAYVRVVKIILDRRTIDEEKLQQVDEIILDSAKTQAIHEAAKSSMGMDISEIDLINISAFADRVIQLSDYRKGLAEYLRSKMSQVAPNLSTLIGDLVGARLISHAGSLTNLAKYPASTVQILGAEKALFRALKTRGNTPKYGLIFHSTFIGRAAAKNKGRISRYLANKCSIASRIDCFTEVPTTVFGSKLRDQVEERLKFFETGELPRKNAEVMTEAIQEAEDMRQVLATKAKKKKKKKDKKVKKEESNGHAVEMEQASQEEMDVTQEVEDEEPPAKKSKKKKKKKE